MLYHASCIHEKAQDFPSLGQFMLAASCTVKSSDLKHATCTRALLAMCSFFSTMHCCCAHASSQPVIAVLMLQHQPVF
eukprot:1137606-Pelagomonas_calceolata.AAC.2